MRLGEGMLAGGRAFFSGKRILLTGAAGSVGSALAAELSRAGCSALALMDHHDHGLLQVVEQAGAVAPRTEIIDALCNIRDARRVDSWLRKIKPDLVIHAAALKHVHVGERHPGECILTNLIGMKNVLDASIAAGAEQFLLISTDKAASPVCVMGASKRLAELYLEGVQAERPGATTLKAVRFGNVFASQGSVAPRFSAQIEAGGPLQVTHPDMKRYFMSIDEAVDLILNVAALDDADAPHCGVYFKDMGEAVSILEMGRDMISRSGRDIDIEIVGMRPGEKLNEELFDQYERVSAAGLLGVFRVSPLSRDAHVSAADLAQLEKLAGSDEEAMVRQRVFAHLDARLGRAEPAVG